MKSVALTELIKAGDEYERALAQLISVMEIAALGDPSAVGTIETLTLHLSAVKAISSVALKALTDGGPGPRGHMHSYDPRVKRPPAQYHRPN